MTTLSDMQAQAIRELAPKVSGVNPQDVTTLTGYAGSGKQQPLSCILQTPQGAVRMGDICVGDQVFGVAGLPVDVIAIHPQGVQPVYRITFRDGSSTRCGAEHLWTVTTPQNEYKGREPKTMPLRELIESDLRHASGPYKFKIPLCGAVQYPSKDYVIHPYILGALLADGSLVEGKPLISVSERDQDIIERVISLLPTGMAVTSREVGSCPQYYIKDDVGHYHTNRFSNEIRRLGIDVLSADKTIPQEYLQGSVEQRMALVQGLMDGDGSCNQNRTSFSSKARGLIEGLKTLVQSLGGTAIEASSGRDDEFHLNVKMFTNPFTTAFKASRWSLSAKNPPSRYIVDIVREGKEEQQCITVSAPDGLYLTDEFIVTHNSTIQTKTDPVGELGASFVTGAAVAALITRADERPAVHRPLDVDTEPHGMRLKADTLQVQLDPERQGDHQTRIVRLLAALVIPV